MIDHGTDYVAILTDPNYSKVTFDNTNISVLFLNMIVMRSSLFLQVLEHKNNKQLKDKRSGLIKYCRDFTGNDFKEFFDPKGLGLYSKKAEKK